MKLPPDTAYSLKLKRILDNHLPELYNLEPTINVSVEDMKTTSETLYLLIHSLHDNTTMIFVHVLR